MISKRTSRTYVTHAEDAPSFWMIGVLWSVLITSTQSGNSMCLLDQLCSAGSGPPRHTHTQEEGLYVAAGKVTFNAGGEELVAEAGALVTVPRHTEHSFLVDEDALLINFYFPGGFDLWLMGLAVPAQSHELPPEFMPPEHDRLELLEADYSGKPMVKERTTSPNPDAAAAPSLSTRRTAENFWFNRGCWSVLADASSTGGSFSMFEVEAPRGLLEGPHLHDFVDEAYYVLEGELEVFVDDRVHGLRRGSLVFVPRGSVHALRVTSDSARFVVMHTTPGFERRVRASGTPVAKPGLPSADWRQEGQPPERLAEIDADIGFREIAIPGDFTPSA